MRLERWIGRTAAVAAAVFFLAGCSTPVDDAFKAKAERKVELDYPLGSGSALAVSTASGSIRVAGHQTNDAHVVATIVARAATRQQARELAEQVTVRFERTGNGVQIKVDRPAPASKRSVSVSYEINVPRQTDIDCDSASGAVDLTDLIGAVTGRTASGPIAAARITGSIQLQSTSGAIRCEQIDRGDIRLDNASGSLHLIDASTIGTCQMGAASGSVTAQRIEAKSIRMDCASAGVTAHDVRAELVNLRSASGKVAAREISCERLQAESTSGHVSVAFSSDAPGDVAAGLKSGSGGVTVVMPRSFAGQVDLRAGSGSVRLSQPIAARGKPGKNYISGTIGSGSGSLLVRSGSGAIRVR